MAWHSYATNTKTVVKRPHMLMSAEPFVLSCNYLHNFDIFFWSHLESNTKCALNLSASCSTKTPDDNWEEQTWKGKYSGVEYFNLRVCLDCSQNLLSITFRLANVEFLVTRDFPLPRSIRLQTSVAHMGVGPAAHSPFPLTDRSLEMLPPNVFLKIFSQMFVFQKLIPFLFLTFYKKFLNFFSFFLDF
jgi:hypothetical protein